jgi:hypothetical protein
MGARLNVGIKMANYDDLLREAERLGIPTNSGIYKPNSEAWSQLQISEYELHRRIREEQRHRREHQLWIVAVVSAFIALLSAFGAWWPLIRLL